MEKIFSVQNLIYLISAWTIITATLLVPTQGFEIEYHLTHWGRVTHICVSKLTIIGSDNGLSPDRRQAIMWTNAGILLIGPLGTNFNEISIEILKFSFKKMRLKVSSAKRRPFCLGLNVLIVLRYFFKWWIPDAMLYFQHCWMPVTDYNPNTLKRHQIRISEV